MPSTTLADPMFANIFNTAVAEPYDADAVRQALINHGERIMKENQIVCETTEEHSHPATPSTTIHTSSLCESTQTNATPPQTIQGVSGAQYAPMDTSPQPKETRLDQLTTLLNETLKQIVIELTHSKDQQTNLEEAVNTTLEQAEWFRHRVEDSVTDAIRDTDFDYEIGNQVERYMRNEFDPDDHVDFRELVADRVDAIIDGLLEDAIETHLADILEEKLKNANITINF